MAFAALLALALSGAPTPASKPAAPEGAWGGVHVALTVTSHGGAIEFDCAHGSLAERIVPDGSGRFEVSGVFVAERPGPVRQGDDEAGKKARYSGRVDGDAMTLSVVVEGSDEKLGPFTLERGRLPRLFKCQ
jgi:hypothetical protein